jgi:hypothetical protein
VRHGDEAIRRARSQRREQEAQKRQEKEARRGVDIRPVLRVGFEFFRFAKEVSSLLVSFIPLAFASRCGNDVVVSSEWKAKRASKWGAKPPTPPFFSFFSPFSFLLRGARVCRIRKKMKKKRRGAIWRAGPRRAPLDAHRDVGTKAEKREGEEEEAG